MRGPQFLDFVASAAYTAGRVQITRVDTLFSGFDNPCGLRITMADGDVLLLRLLSVGVPPADAVTVAQPHDVPPAPEE